MEACPFTSTLWGFEDASNSVTVEQIEVVLREHMDSLSEYEAFSGFLSSHGQAVHVLDMVGFLSTKPDNHEGF